MTNKNFYLCINMCEPDYCDSVNAKGKCKKFKTIKIKSYPATKTNINQKKGSE